MPRGLPCAEAANGFLWSVIAIAGKLMQFSNWEQTIQEEKILGLQMRSLPFFPESSLGFLKGDKEAQMKGIFLQ